MPCGHERSIIGDTYNLQSITYVTLIVDMLARRSLLAGKIRLGHALIRHKTVSWGSHRSHRKYHRNSNPNSHKSCQLERTCSVVAVAVPSTATSHVISLFTHIVSERGLSQSTGHEMERTLGRTCPSTRESPRRKL
jgi:hypothetical protein